MSDSAFKNKDGLTFNVCIDLLCADGFCFVQMEDQAESGLFLPHDVCREQRGLLCPGMSLKKKTRVPLITC